MSGTMPDVLARICAETREEMERRRRAVSIEALRRKIQENCSPPRGFTAALKDAVVSGRCGLIAEVKKASPSGGLIRPEFDPAQIARDYEAAGATCLSVLTDAPFFQGAPEHLLAARRATTLPVLRKDFILDPWQIYESRAMGADCILLIMATLANDQARELEAVAQTLEMDVLVEVHDHSELDRALGMQTPLVGVNNRNLRTLQTDLRNTIELAPFVPQDRLLVAESGIRSHADVHRLGAAGAQCFLVGESLLRQSDLQAAVRDLLGT